MQQNSNSILQQHPIPSAFPAHLFAHVCEKQYLCISEDSPPKRREAWPQGDSFLSGIASCTFVRTNSVRPPQSHLATFKEAGGMSPRNSVSYQRKEPIMEQKTKRLWIRLSPDEEALFRRKAARYKTVSAMVRDAVRQFDDTATRGKIDAINRMTDLYLKHQQELSWLGGNFNQTVKRANELAIGQQLTPQFFEQVLYPQVEQIQSLLHDIKREQHQIAKQLTHF